MDILQSRDQSTKNTDLVEFGGQSIMEGKTETKSIAFDSLFNKTEILSSKQRASSVLQSRMTADNFRSVRGSQISGSKREEPARLASVEAPLW